MSFSEQLHSLEIVASVEDDFFDSWKVQLEGLGRVSPPKGELGAVGEVQCRKRFPMPELMREEGFDSRAVDEHALEVLDWWLLVLMLNYEIHQVWTSDLPFVIRHFQAKDAQVLDGCGIDPEVADGQVGQIQGLAIRQELGKFRYGHYQV